MSNNNAPMAESPSARNTRLAEELAEAKRLSVDPDVPQRISRRARRQIDEIVAELWKVNFPLVMRYASKFDTGDSESLEAYREAGQMALAESIMSWDPAKGKLSTWAWPRIKKSVLDEVGRKEHRLKAHAFAARPLVLRALEELRHELAHARQKDVDVSAEPTEQQVAERAELPPSLVKHILANEALGRTVSLNAPAGEDGSELMALVPVADYEDTEPLSSFADISASDLKLLTEDVNMFELVCGLRRMNIGGDADFHEIGALLSVSREAARKGYERFSTKVQEAAIRHGFGRD